MATADPHRPSPDDVPLHVDEEPLAVEPTVHGRHLHDPGAFPHREMGALAATAVGLAVVLAILALVVGFVPAILVGAVAVPYAIWRLNRAAQADRIGDLRRHRAQIARQPR